MRFFLFGAASRRTFDISRKEETRQHRGRIKIVIFLFLFTSHVFLHKIYKDCTVSVLPSRSIVHSCIVRLLYFVLKNFTNTPVVNIIAIRRYWRHRVKNAYLRNSSRHDFRIVASCRKKEGKKYQRKMGATSDAMRDASGLLSFSLFRFFLPSTLLLSFLSASANKKK